MSKVIKVEFGKRAKPDSIESELDPFVAAAEEAVGPFAELVLRKRELGILDFDWDPLVTRLDAKSGSEYDDELDFTQAGRTKFSEIFIQTFGFPRLPSTWGELMALYDYCSAMDSSANSGIGLETTAQYWPSQVPVMLAYLNGNRFELKRWHTEQAIQEITEFWIAQ